MISQFLFFYLKLQPYPPKPECLKYQPDNPLISFLVVDDGGKGGTCPGGIKSVQFLSVGKLVSWMAKKTRQWHRPNPMTFPGGGINWEIPNESKRRLRDAPETNVWNLSNETYEIYEMKHMKYSVNIRCLFLFLPVFRLFWIFPLYPLFYSLTRIEYWILCPVCFPPFPSFTVFTLAHWKTH